MTKTKDLPQWWLEFRERDRKLAKAAFDAGSAHTIGSHRDFKQIHPDFEQWLELYLKEHNMAKEPHRMLKWFEYAHLPPHLQEVSEAFHAMAHHLDRSLPDCPEKSAGMRKLLEAKDCFVRAKLEQQ